MVVVVVGSTLNDVRRYTGNNSCCNLVCVLYVSVLYVHYIQGYTHTTPTRPSNVSRLQGLSLVLCVCGILDHVHMYAHMYISA